MSEPNMEKFNELTALDGPLTESLSRAVSFWLSNSDRSVESWERMMNRKLSAGLVAYLMGSYSDVLAARGLIPLDEGAVRALVAEVLAGTGDIRSTLVNAPQRVVVGGFFRDTVLGPLHQNRIIKSITRKVQDLFTTRSVEQTPGWTGRRKWITNVVSSRHAALHGEIRDESQLFQVGHDLWYGPREDITNGNEASGCRCELVWEYVDENGDVSWR